MYSALWRPFTLAIHLVLAVTMNRDDEIMHRADRKKQEGLAREQKPLSQAYLAGSLGGQQDSGHPRLVEEGSDRELDLD